MHVNNFFNFMKHNSILTSNINRHEKKYFAKFHVISFHHDPNHHVNTEIEKLTILTNKPFTVNVKSILNHRPHR